MKFIKLKSRDLMFLVVLALVIIPQSRETIQIAFHSILSKFNPVIIHKSAQQTITYSPWVLRDLKGNEMEYSDTKNQVVFLNLWATWCPPCIAEFQGIQELYNDYKNDVVFLLVSDETPIAIQNFLKKNGYDINVFIPMTKYPIDFNPKSIPRTYIIDSKGSIVIDKKGAANWSSSKVRKILNKLLKES